MSTGDRLVVPIFAMNTDKDLWGADAFEFKYVPSIRIHCHSKLIPDPSRPDRWKSPPEAVSEHPGVWSNLMSFLGGTRACIGYQFTLLESVSSLPRIS
jgi:hypothetical protein